MGKDLSAKQAQRCEEAIGDVCHCRCGGALHGSRRGGTNADGSIDRVFFEALPADDPHYLPSAAVKKTQQQKERQIKSLERRIAQCRGFGLDYLATVYEQELAALVA